MAEPNMRAVVQGRYGDPADVLEVRDVAVPTMADDEVLVRVRAASVHPDVWHVVRGWPRVLRIMGAGLVRPSPSVPGTDMAGEVVAVGTRVTRFAPGDEVFGETILGMQWRHGGAWAEFVSVSQEALAPKPPNVTFEQAATIPTAGLIVLANLPDLDDRPWPQRVLVNGAAGGVGSIALQVARAQGAHVTAVDHADKLDLVRSLGADEVVDYTSTDVTGLPDEWDLVFDVVGNHPYAAHRPRLADGGTYVLIGHDQYGTQGRRWVGSVPGMLALMVRATRDASLPTPSFTQPDRRRSMQQLHDLMADGALTPVVARAFPLEGAAEALGTLASGMVPGRLVVVPGPGAAVRT